MMTRYMSSHAGRTMRPEPYDVNYGDDEDDDDDDFDDDDLDGYDNLTDYDDEDEPSRSRSGGRHPASGSVDGRIGCFNDSRRQRSVSEGSGSLLEPCDDNRRDHHNQLERKRRASIKTSYNDLREAIPSLRGSKASRAVILQRAVECIEELLKRNRDHSHCVETLRRQNDLLDSRVQELQRLVQRLDGEEAAAAVAVAAASSAVSHGHNNYPNGTGTATSSGCGGGGATLRLVSGNITSPGVSTSGSGTAHLPVYRLMPQESSGSDRIANSNGVTHVLTSTSTATRSNSLGGVHHGSTSSSRTRVSPALHPIASHPSNTNGHNLSPSFNGLSLLNTAVSLVASAHSAFSSASSPSVGSTNGDATAPQSSSSSQRSSPGSYSSTSSSSACSISLGNPTAPSRRLLPATSMDDESVVEELTVVSTNSVDNKPKSSSPPVPSLAPPLAPAPSMTSSHPASPPPILLAVPVRHPPSNASTQEESLLSKRRRLS